MRKPFLYTFLLFIALSCKKNNVPAPAPPAPHPFSLVSASVNDSAYNNMTLYNVKTAAVIRLSFSAPVNRSTVPDNVSVITNGVAQPISFSYANSDSTLILQSDSALNALTIYGVNASTGLHSVADSSLTTPVAFRFVTTFDPADKFPRITDSALLTLVEQQTFKYFYDFGHPVSGMARERNNSGDVVTTGGSGFGIMATLTAIERNFISRTDGLSHIIRIVDFLTNKAHRYHGAFPHWMNGVTGATIPFSTQDDGADLVETSYMIEGLLCARQFFNSPTDPDEIALRSAINAIYDGVEWNWFRQGGQNALFWHWSPDYQFAINQQISGWDEALIVYVLAASSPIDSNRIPKIVYDNGWALDGAIRNGKAFYGITLPLGPDYGGPLFFAHYSFLGINPHGLSDAYADYWTQDTAHARINYLYCAANPRHYVGYSDSCWGLTAGDDNVSGYSAHSPTNDVGVISPTAALSSLPYTPVESMNALRFFYYKLGDRIWGNYGFTDAFNLTDIWFDDSYLAIDQGPEVVMIENYRSGLLWNLFMSCPEIKSGMKALGFQSAQLN